MNHALLGFSNNVPSLDFQCFPTAVPLTVGQLLGWPQGAIDPSGLATLRGWFRADIGVYKDSGVTPVSSDADTIGYWKDQSPRQMHMGWNSGSTKAVWKTGIVGGYPAVRVAGATQMDAGLIHSLDQVVIAVVKKLTNNGANQGLFVGWTGTGFNDNVMLQRSTGNFAIWDPNNSWREDGAASTTAFEVLTASRSDSAKVVKFYHGTSLTHTVGFSGSSNTGVIASSLFKANGEFMSGDLAELIVISGNDPASILGLQLYLMAKYGL